MSMWACRIHSAPHDKIAGKDHRTQRHFLHEHGRFPVSIYNSIIGNLMPNQTSGYLSSGFMSATITPFPAFIFGKIQ